VCSAEAPAILFGSESAVVVEGEHAPECAVEAGPAAAGAGAGARGGAGPPSPLWPYPQGRPGEYTIEEGRRQGGKDVEARAAIRVEAPALLLFGPVVSSRLARGRVRWRRIQTHLLRVAAKAARSEGRIRLRRPPRQDESEYASARSWVALQQAAVYSIGGWGKGGEGRYVPVLLLFAPVLSSMSALSRAARSARGRGGEQRATPARGCAGPPCPIV
jgi:hypothetical protein